jgi:hypothetical protein
MNEDNKIEFNLREGDSVQINAEHISMHGVKQTVAGGYIAHQASERLIQTGNTMIVANGGKIINEVKNGTLRQTGNTMKVEKDGSIINKVSESGEGNDAKESI